jgi:antitoxin ParD1/3/4
LLFLPKIGNFAENRKVMMRNTSVSLGSYFEKFVEKKIAQGRYKNASEVIRSGLRLLEAEENRIAALKNALQEGLDSGIATEFNPQSHLQSLKARRHNG